MERFSVLLVPTSRDSALRLSYARVMLDVPFVILKYSDRPGVNIGFTSSERWFERQPRSDNAGTSVRSQLQAQHKYSEGSIE